MGQITRRVFLGLGIATVGGLAVGAYYVRRPWDNPLTGEGGAVFNPWVIVGEDGKITVIVPRAEMGQGVSTTLAALVAEELDVSLEGVTVAHGPASPAYFNAAVLAEGAPFAAFDDGAMAEATRAVSEVGAKLLGLQLTGGSSSTIDAFEKMRRAGAAAREQLRLAASRRLGVEIGAIRTEDGAAIGPDGARLSYGELALQAASMPPPGFVALRPPETWKLLGRSQPRVDMRDKVTGAPIYGIDVDLPEMLFATVRMSPRFGAGAARADEAAALAVPGVLKVVPLETAGGSGFGVIAENTWAAFKGAEALEIEWEAADYPPDEAAQGAALARALDEEEGFEMGGAGDAAYGLEIAPRDEMLEVEYRVPFLAHACMEPMNATARLRGGRLEVWVGTQAPTVVQEVCAGAVGLSADQAEVNVTALGGGFGRRIEVDAALYATLLAAHADGRPVKTTWTREEDMRRDVYRPAALGRFRAHVRPGEGPVSVEMRIAAPAIIPSLLARTWPSIPAVGPDKTILDGAFNQPWGYENARFEGVPVDLGVPVGFWRSVGGSFNGFFHECLMDECAHAAGVDPVEMRLRLMQGETFAPARKAVEKVAEMSNWGSAEAGRARGIAFVLSFGAWVAQVAEVSRSPEGVRIENVWCAADPGRVLDPAIYEAQMMSGIVFGLSAAMGQATTFAEGEAQELNFDAFDAMRMAQTPNIEVALLENAPRMGGAGEPGTPPVIPALGNALFALTGTRLRETPFGRFIDFV